MDDHVLNILRIIVAVVGMSYASYADIKDREIPDIVWNSMIVAGTIFFSIQLLTSVVPEQLFVKFSMNVLFAVLLGWGMYAGPWVLGGADVKAFTVLAVLLPVVPTTGYTPYYMATAFPPWDYVIPLMFLVILSNTSIFALFYPVSLILQTVRDGYDSSQPLISILGRKELVDNLREKHAFVAELSLYPQYQSQGAYSDYLTITSQGITTSFIDDYLTWKEKQENRESISFRDVTHWNLQAFFDESENYSLKFEDSDIGDSIDDLEQVLTNLQQSDSVYIIPGHPYIVLLTLGVFTTLVFGDVIAYVAIVL